MFLEDKDITSQFDRKANLRLTSGVVGLQPLYCKVELSQDAFVFNYSYHEKVLSCQASLAAEDVPPTLNSSLVHMNADLNITLLCE